MIKTVCRSYGWASPGTIDEMYCDNLDYHGIEFWYEDVKRQHRDLESKK